MRSRSHSPQVTPPQYVPGNGGGALRLGSAAAALASVSKALEVRSASSVSIHGSVASARLGSGGSTHSARNLFPEVHLPRQQSEELLEVIPLEPPAAAPAPAPASYARGTANSGGFAGSSASVGSGGGFAAAMGGTGPRPGQKWRFALSAARTGSLGASSFGSVNSATNLLADSGGSGGEGSSPRLLRHNPSQLQQHHQFYAQQLSAGSLPLSDDDDARFYNRHV